MKNSYFFLDLLMVGILALAVSRCGKTPDPVTPVAAQAVQIGNPALPGQNCSWLPVDGLKDPNVAQPMALPKKTTVYTETCTSPCGVAKASMTFHVWKEQPDGSVKEVLD